MTVKSWIENKLRDALRAAVAAFIWCILMVMLSATIIDVIGAVPASPTMFLSGAFWLVLFPMMWLIIFFVNLIAGRLVLKARE